MQKGNIISSGKTKTLYATDNPEWVIMEFRDDISAYEVKKAKLADKGKVNSIINAYIMQQLKQAGIPLHFEKQLSDYEALVKRLDMIPVECVVRNIAAGSLCRRLGIEEGRELNPPLLEFFLKNDALHDPILAEAHIFAFGWAGEKELSIMKELSFKVNNVLKPLFAKAGMLLVDFKLEFGRLNDEIILGDEFTPDGCRLWDSQTREILDKDRFRKDLGDVVEHYKEIAQRLGLSV